MKIIAVILFAISFNFAFANEPEFSTDWFSNHAPNWKKVTNHLKGKPNMSCLEIGSFEGRSTIFIAEEICNGPNSTVTAVDAWEKVHDGYNKFNKPYFETFKTNLNQHLKSGRVIPIKGESKIELVNLLYQVQHDKEPKFDFIYIDGSHRAKDVLVDTVLSWELLKVGGIIIFDDYNWTDSIDGTNIYPKTAINGFLKSYKGMYKILHRDYQLIIQKTSNEAQHDRKAKLPFGFYLYDFFNNVSQMIN